MDPNDILGGDGGEQGGQQAGLDMGQLRQMAFNQFQQKVFDWLDNTRADIHARQASTWRDEEEAVRMATQIEEKGQAEEAITAAFSDLQANFVNLLMTYMDHHQNPNTGVDDLKEAIGGLVVEFHNPETRESILLAVDEEHRDLMRDRLKEFGSAIWGMYELLSGSDGDDKWFFVDMMAAVNGTDVESVVQQIQGVSVDEIPPKYRQ